MKVEIWSDVVCPWCYIGKRKFEAALDEFSHRDGVEIVWRSYQLDPTAPSGGKGSVRENLASKYGVSLAQADAMQERVTSVAAEVGLEYHLDKTVHANTFDAHRLIHLAASHGLQDAAEERLMHGYFSEGQPIGEHETLVKLISEVGVDAEEARKVLASDRFASDVDADLRRAAGFGIRGVPFFVFDEKYGVSGAQSSEVFAEVLEQTWAESHPLITVGGASQDADMCADGSCAV